MSERARRVLYWAGRVLWTLLLAAWFGAVAFSCIRPMLRQDKVLNTMANDLSVHVRHAWEYGRALREGQFPPLVMPVFEGGTRVPLYQYYSNTPYFIPGALSKYGVEPYIAMKVSVWVHIFAAGVFTYLACRALRLTFAASVLAGTAYQLFPFAGCDLIARGSYTEFAAMETVPAVFFCGVHLVRATGRREVWLWLCLTTLAVAYFIPVHPVQTFLCGALVMALLAVHALFDAKTGWRGVGRLFAGLAGGAAGSAYFWFPLALVQPELRVSTHAALLDAGFASAKMLFWPVYLRHASVEWGPQLGIHFAVAAGLVPFSVYWWKRPARALGLTAALALATLVSLILWYDRVPRWLFELLKPMQWTYRMLVPAALAGTLCLALVFDWGMIVLRRWWARAPVLLAVLGYVVWLSPPYFAGQAIRYITTPQEIVEPGWPSPNTLAYALRGNDYNRLAIVRPDGMLNTGAPVYIVAEGYPTEVELVVRAEGSTSGTEADVGVTVGDPNGAPPAAGVAPPRDEKARLPDGSVRLAFSFTPNVGHTAGHTVMRFESNPPGVNWKVEDLTFRVVGEGPEKAVRLPPNVERKRGGRRREFIVTVPPGKAGLYQLPVYYLPSNVIIVNGVRQTAHPSINRSMVVVPLREGFNRTKVRTRAMRGPAYVAAGTLIAALAGAVVAAAWPRQRPAPSAGTPGEGGGGGGSDAGI